ncbi:MAG: SAM-dependent methyltransferase, partial [Planctomycetota bacterium]
MRALSLARWHHFAYMIVSVALLGFGASGTLISLFRRRLLRRFEASVTAFAAAFALTLPLSFILAQRVPFDAFQLAWDWHQYLYLFEYYLLLVVPFLLGATCIGLALVREAERAHRVYFWNLLGSGLG